MGFAAKDWVTEINPEGPPADPSTATEINGAALTDLETRLSGYTDAQVAALAALTVKGKTGAYTFVLADATATEVDLNASSAFSFTIPKHTTTAIPVGSQLVGRQIGAGALTFVGASGVTVNGTVTTAGQFQTLVATQTATDVWDVVGSNTGAALSGTQTGQLAYVAVVREAPINACDPQYGAVADGSDVGAAINAALAVAAAAGGGEVILQDPFPTANFVTSQTIVVPDRTTLRGAWVRAADGWLPTIQQAAGANLDALISDGYWHSNNGFVGVGPRLVNLNVDGNMANQSAGAGHAVAFCSWRSQIKECAIANARGDGIRLSTLQRNGTTSATESMVESRVEKCELMIGGGSAIHVVEGATKGLITDGFCEDNLVAGLWNGSGILMEQSADWVVAGNHTYGTGAHGISLKNAGGGTRLHHNFVEYIGNVASVGNVFAFYVANIFDTSIMGNHCNVVQSYLGSGNTPFGLYLENGSGVSYTTFSLVMGNFFGLTGTAAGTGLRVVKSGTGAILLGKPTGANMANGFTTLSNIDAGVTQNTGTGII